MHENKIPDFDKSPAAVLWKLLVLPAGFGRTGAQVVVNLGTRAARTGLAHLPEVVLLVEPEDAIFGHAGNLLPELLSFVVLAENGHIQPLLGHAVALGNQLPGKVDGVGLEVVAETEIAHHLEERVVAARVADVFEIVVLAAGANALLGSRGAGIIAFLNAEKNVLELVHAGVGKQQRRIVGGNQGRGMHNAVVPRGKVIEELLANFVTGHSVSIFACQSPKPRIFGHRTQNGRDRDPARCALRRRGGARS